MSYECVRCGGASEDAGTLEHESDCLFWRAYDALDDWAAVALEPQRSVLRAVVGLVESFAVVESSEGVDRGPPAS